MAVFGIITIIIYEVFISTFYIINTIEIIIINTINTIENMVNIITSINTIEIINIIYNFDIMKITIIIGKIIYNIMINIINTI